MEPILWQHRLVVRLFRVWALVREDGEATLGRMHALACEFRLPDHTAVACSSLFALVESTVGRRLVRGAGCAPAFSADETALLGVIEAAPSLGAMRGSARVPHGLPGAVRWAALCVRDAIGWPDRATAFWPALVPRDRCPFSANPEHRLAS